KIDIPPLCINLHRRKSLSSVTVEERPFGVRKLYQLRDILNSSHLIIDRHDRDHKHIIIQLPIQRAHIYTSRAVYRNEQKLEAATLGSQCGRLHYTGMLDRTDQNGLAIARAHRCDRLKDMIV